jgi:hypothetical protein
LAGASATLAVAARRRQQASALHHEKAPQVTASSLEQNGSSVSPHQFNGNQAAPGARADGKSQLLVNVAGAAMTRLHVERLRFPTRFNATTASSRRAS